jgi:hypothetical protein
LERDAAKVGLKINDQKTKYMIAAQNDRKIRDVGQSVATGYKNFDVVKEFVYLGSLMTPTNDVSLEIQKKSQTAIGASSDCVNICGRATFYARQNSLALDLDMPSPALRQ